MLKLIAMRMKDQMERAPNLNDILATFPELMLWILFVGGQVAETERKPFFARQASKILLMKRIENQTDILHASQNFLWPERNSMEDDGLEEDFDEGWISVFQKIISSPEPWTRLQVRYEVRTKNWLPAEI